MRVCVCACVCVCVCVKSAGKSIIHCFSRFNTNGCYGLNAIGTHARSEGIVVVLCVCLCVCMCVHS